MSGAVRSRVFAILQPSEPGDVVSRVFDYVLTALIVLSAVVAVAETFDLSPAERAAASAAETALALLFTAEYVLRLWTADLLCPGVSRGRAIRTYMTSFNGLVDLAAVAPFWLASLLPVNLMALRMLRLFRLLRVFKLGRFYNGLAAVGRAFSAKKHELISSVLVIAVLMVVASVAMYSIESEAQPDAFSNALDAMWWAVCTLTTVGYGDIYPVTVAGRVLSTVIALLGIGIVAIPSGIVSAGFVEQAHGVEQEAETKKYCPYCGRGIE